MGERTKVVAFTHATNVLGTVDQVRRPRGRARAVGAITVLDACQSVPYLRAWTSPSSASTSCLPRAQDVWPHRASARCGGATSWWKLMPPILTGGSAIECGPDGGATTLDATPAGSRPAHPWRPRPSAWQAAVGLPEPPGHDGVTEHEARAHPDPASGEVWRSPLVRVGGPADDRHRPGAVASVEGVHAHDVGQILDDAGYRRPGGPPRCPAAAPCDSG